MQNTPDPDELKIRYILGELPEDEHLALEEKVFSDDEAYQEMVALEDELRYEYARGGLTADQRTSFERRFLQRPEDRERIELAREVLDKAQEVRREAERPVAAPVPEAREPWWRRVSGIFAIGSPVMQYGMAAAALLLLTGGSWLAVENIRLQHQVGSLEAQQRVEKQRDIARQSEEQRLRTELAMERDRLSELERQQGKESGGLVLLSFVLTPGLSRDAEGPKRLVVPAGIKEVRLRLKLDEAVQKCRMSLQTLDGVEIWKQDAPRPVASVPGRLLVPGDYMLNVKGLTDQGEASTDTDFYFSVTSK